MKKETERKFLVRGEAWRDLAPGVAYRQGYLQTSPCTVRVRAEGSRGVLTIKGPTHGCTRSEFEYEIPLEEAEAMLDTLALHPLIRKTRYTIFYRGFVWEVDEFSDENVGLVVAEIELEDEEQVFDKPEWIGAEVTHDRRYANAALVRHPFSRW